MCMIYPMKIKANYDGVVCSTLFWIIKESFKFYIVNVDMIKIDEKNQTKC